MPRQITIPPVILRSLANSGIDQRKKLPNKPARPVRIILLVKRISFWTDCEDSLFEIAMNPSCGLTPELSRTALRPWASETCKNLHEAAKRARLERIVRPVPAVALDQEPMNWAKSRPDDCSLRSAEPRNGVPAALAGTEFVARIKSLD